jgi:hypothetical protein
MKKSALAIAITAVSAMNTGTNAQIANADFVVGLPFGVDIEVDCFSTFGGVNTWLSTATTNGASFLTGNLCLDPSSGFYILFQFGLTSNSARGDPGGTLFDGGTIDIYTNTSGYLYTIDASNPGSEVDSLGKLA